MIVGIVGLGLIGGSLAKAYKREEEVYLMAYDIDKTSLDFAILAGDVDAVLTPDRLKECDIVFISTYPAASMEYMRQNADLFNKDGIVMDCVGTKTEICRFGFALAREHNFTFVGGHPMGGTQFSGYKYSKASMFDHAPMVIVPPVYDDIQFFDRIDNLLKPVRFGRLSITTAEEHDAMIAYTSQMCHIVSNAFIKSPTAGSHKGFSAGSYRDLTRVAHLAPKMWTELIMENRAAVQKELQYFMSSMQAYCDAVAAGDADGLCRLLREGSDRKDAIDG